MTESDNLRGNRLVPGTPPGEVVPGSHDRHCFVVMPFGRDGIERRWYAGWYKVVIRPAVVLAGYEPVLAATEEQPSAINDEIRSHLAFDPMVVVDLGGPTPEHAPNPNVMYELGIRHAFGLPLVLMAWEGQSLPFDVSNQRAIMESRDILSQELNRDKLVRFIEAAGEGRYYRPMDAVGRHAAIEATVLGMGQDSLLGALAREVSDLRSELAGAFRRADWLPPKGRDLVLKDVLNPGKRKQLWGMLSRSGVRSDEWGRVLRKPITHEQFFDMEQWGLSEWAVYITKRMGDRVQLKGESSIGSPEGTTPVFAARSLSFGVDEEILASVKGALPEQPWPKGVHRVVAERLSLPSRTVSHAMQDLIRRGDFKPQVGGVVVEAEQGDDSDA